MGVADPAKHPMRGCGLFSVRCELTLAIQLARRRKDNGEKNWLGLGPNDAPLAVRDVSTYDIYALDLDLP